MKPILNEAPNIVLQALECKDYSYFYGIWPDKVKVRQDGSRHHYIDLLESLLLKTVPPTHLETVTGWQCLETYRVINAAISSSHNSLEPYLANLIEIRKKLEALTPISQLLKNINEGRIKTDIICAGHGSWVNKYELVQFNGSEAKVLLYSGVGAAISDELGILIENQMMDRTQVAVKNANKNVRLLLPATIAYPQPYDRNSEGFLPNYDLICDRDGKLRIIETMTGRILYESKKRITLNEIMTLYPNRIIHWAACAKLYDYKSNQPLGPYANCKFFNIRKHELKTSTQISNDDFYKSFPVQDNSLICPPTFFSNPKVDVQEEEKRKRPLNSNEENAKTKVHCRSG